jgi:hypothetical protein
VTPDGFLPVFSVDTDEEARRLIVATCKLGNDGEYYATELLREQTLENLMKFSDRLAEVHDIMKERGRCTCGH